MEEEFVTAAPNTVRDGRSPLISSLKPQTKATAVFAIGIVVSLLALATPSWAAPWEVRTYAGGGVGDGGPADAALVRGPRRLAVDTADNLYIAEYCFGRRIRRIDTKGSIRTVAGAGNSVFVFEPGPSDQVSLGCPSGVAADGDGNVFIGDPMLHRVLKVDETGWVTSLAQVTSPEGLAVGAAGDLYVADPEQRRILRIDRAGVVSTIAGTGAYGTEGDGGPATSASFMKPTDVALDAAGNLYVADANAYRVRRIRTDGVIDTVAGTGSYGSGGDGGPATQATLKYPSGIGLDRNGNLYIADGFANRVRRVTAEGIIGTVAGTGVYGSGGDGGPATQAAIAFPEDVAVDKDGDLFVTDRSEPNRIRKVDTSGIISTIAGGVRAELFGDGGMARGAWLAGPENIAFDAAGNLYIAEQVSHAVRRVDPSGITTTIAGTGSNGFSGDGGKATEAMLDWPNDVAADGAGNIYIADSRNHRIRKVDPTGIITTVAGTGQSGSVGDGGPATLAQLNWPQGVAVDAAGNLYIADTSNSRIRKVDRSGIISTIAGGLPSALVWYLAGEAGDGLPATLAGLRGPMDLEFDAAGNLYVNDTYNYRIRKIDREGTITTVAGNGAQGFSGDGGPATAASLNTPLGISLDPNGNLYIADWGNRRIRRVDPSGTISTVAGTGAVGMPIDGQPASSAKFEGLNDVQIGPQGDLYVSDLSASRIFAIDLP